MNDGGNGGHGWRKSSHSTTNGCLEVRFAKSSYSGSGGCVEVGRTSHGEVWVRDSKDREGPILAFTAEEWRAFLAGVRGGEFDLREAVA
jgi:hypothetical protein